MVGDAEAPQALGDIVQQYRRLLDQRHRQRECRRDLAPLGRVAALCPVAVECHSAWSSVVRETLWPFKENGMLSHWWKFQRSLPTILWWLVLGVILIGTAALIAISP